MSTIAQMRWEEDGPCNQTDLPPISRFSSSALSCLPWPPRTHAATAQPSSQPSPADSCLTRVLSRKRLLVVSTMINDYGQNLSINSSWIPGHSGWRSLPWRRGRGPVRGEPARVLGHDRRSSLAWLLGSFGRFSCSPSYRLHIQMW